MLMTMWTRRINVQYVVLGLACDYAQYLRNNSQDFREHSVAMATHLQTITESETLLTADSQGQVQL